MKLINISNHNSQNWSKEQKVGFQEIIDVQFPNIPANATTIAYDLLDKLTVVKETIFQFVQWRVI